MWWLLILAVVVVGLVLFARTSRTTPPLSGNAPTAATVVALVENGPSWMSAEDWDSRLVAYRKQGRSDADIAT